MKKVLYSVVRVPGVKLILVSFLEYDVKFIYIFFLKFYETNYFTFFEIEEARLD